MSNSIPKSCLYVMAFMCFLAGCKSIEQHTYVNSPSVLDITNASSMNKDAVRLIVVVLKVNSPQNGDAVYQVRVKEVVKYGGTFSSIEPKPGESVILLTPENVTFNKGDVIQMDVLTPRVDKGVKPMKVSLA